MTLLLLVHLRVRQAVAVALSTRVELCLCLALTAAAAVLAWNLSQALAFTRTHLDIWFDADSPFVLDQLINRTSPHNDTNNRHPLYALLLVPIVQVIAAVANISRERAADLLQVVISGACVAMFYSVLRLMHRPRAIAAFMTAVLALSSAGLLFLGIHERTVAGALTVLMCLAAFLASRRGLIGTGGVHLAAAATLAVTVTNFVTGVAAILAAEGWRRGVQSAANVLLLVQLLAMFSMLLFPAATAFMDVRQWPIDASVWSEDTARLAKGGTPADKATAFWLHSIALPAPVVRLQPWDRTPYLSVQELGLDAHALAGKLAVLLWVPMLATGLVRVFRRCRGDRMAAVLLTGLLGQFYLFLIFGEETILYSPYFVPLQLLVASYAVPRGRWSLAWIAALMIVIAWNNVIRFGEAVRLALSHVG